MNAIRRWGGYVALVIVFAVVCGLLSWWQWSRREEKLAAIALVEANYDAAPVSLDEVIGDPADFDEDLTWRPVELTGTYDVENTLMVRNRVYGGAPGFEELVPLVLDDGTTFFVDRGWVPLASTGSGPASVPAPASGEVTVLVRLTAAEPVLPGRSAPEGQLATVNLEQAAVAADADQAVTGAYGLLAEETPAAAETPALPERPDLDEGPHLSYALQWIMFGLLAIAGLVWAVRRERRIAALPENEQAAARAPQRRVSVDTEAEDAYLDELERSR